MKNLIAIIGVLTLVGQIANSQEKMTLNEWSYLSDSNVTIMFAKDQAEKKFLIIPVHSYYAALENHLFENSKWTSFINDMNIEFSYDDYIFNADIRNVFLVFDESKIGTSYGSELKTGERICPIQCITDILFNESLREKPEFVVIDNHYFADIELFARNSNYQAGTWLDQLTIELEKTSKIKAKGSEKWISYELSFPYSIDYMTNEPVNTLTSVKIRKLGNMKSYQPKIATDFPEEAGYFTQSAPDERKTDEQ